MSQSIAQLLEDQIEKSRQFTVNNFGLKVGDGFPEIVREILKSEKVAMDLVMNVMLSNLSAKGLAEALKPGVPGEKPDLSNAISKNLAAVEGPLSMFYWGLEIGRAMGLEEAAAQRSLNPSGE